MLSSRRFVGPGRIMANFASWKLNKMGRQLMSKAFRVNESGELLVNFSADRIGGAQVGRAEVSTEDCVPFSGNSPLKDRKYLVITFTTDRVYIDSDNVSFFTSYFSQGTRRGDNGSLPPNIQNYSNRKQFIRGQYLCLSLLSSVQLCAKAPLVEDVTSLELS